MPRVQQFNWKSLYPYLWDHALSKERDADGERSGHLNILSVKKRIAFSERESVFNFVYEINH